MTRILFLLVFGFIAVELFQHLDTHSGGMMPWECETIDGMMQWGKDSPSISQYLQRSLVWDDAPLSGSHSSLLFGFGTYSLLHYFDGSLFLFRLLPALSVLLSALVLNAAMRKFETADPTSIAGAILITHPVALYYAGYGVSAGALLLSQTIMLLTGWWCIQKPSPINGLFFSCAAFLATLSYAPGRLAVIGFTAGVTLILCFRRNTAGQGNRAYALIAMGFVLLGLLLFEKSNHGLQRFVRGRGEQVFELVYNQEDYRQFRSQSSVELITNVILEKGEERLTELGYLFAPKPIQQTPPFFPIQNGDPPRLPLLTWATLPFIILGFIYSLIRYGRIAFTLITLSSAVVLPLFLTNRIDQHRLIPLLIPLCCWIAFGLFAIKRRCGALVMFFCSLLVLGSQLLSSATYLKPKEQIDQAVPVFQQSVLSQNRGELIIYGHGYCALQYATAPLLISEELQGTRSTFSFRSGNPDDYLGTYISSPPPLNGTKEFVFGFNSETAEKFKSDSSITILPLQENLFAAWKK